MYDMTVPGILVKIPTDLSKVFERNHLCKKFKAWTASMGKPWSEV